MSATHQVKKEITRYLMALQQIDAIKQEMVTITEEACEIPGVEKKAFKALAIALHEAQGKINEKVESLDDFIEMAFKDNNQRQTNLPIIRSVP